MSHKRIHIRVPIISEMVLSCGDGLIIKAKTIDISVGGLRINVPSSSPLGQIKYEVEVITIDRGKIWFKALLVHQDKSGAGLKILEIDRECLHKIYQMIGDFQATEEFIKHINEFSILDDWFIDENGAELDVTFEVSGQINRPV